MKGRLDLDEELLSRRESSRPRTKRRPAYPDARVGQVVAADRGRFTCSVDGRDVVAVRAKELRRTPVVVGDLVALVGDLSGRPDSLARIVRIEPRRTVLRRSADDADPEERVIVANADQLAIVCAVANPEPRPRLVDRYLVAAFDGGLDPILVFSKADLADPTPLLEIYRPLGLPMVVTANRQPGPDLPELLRDRFTVLAGASGVGKSTLFNALVPGARRATGEVNEVTGKGRHVTTTTVVADLPGGGRLVDTPGVRSFGLAHLDVRRVIEAFPDLAPATEDCPRGCTHRADAGDECALDPWVAAGRAAPERLRSLRRLLASLEGKDEE
ncbi:MAG: ribosome small subunit-dependent GTPase A [Acidothermus sp.]|nr:ribosome small subunit-dependent GTPase A [Acidothermus sp.]MCL6538845.1 ribosome small subunit-dependent GTPase A [Acidothermus sp.]